MKRLLAATLAIAPEMMFVGAAPSEAAGPEDVHVKKAIADRMTPEQLAAYKQLLAERLSAGVFDHPPGGGPDTPGDICTAATPEIASLATPYMPPPDTTVGAADNYDLPPDSVTPTCTAPTACTGGGPPGSLPRGAIFTGTGTGPDRAYRLVTDSDCSLTIDMVPTSTQDLALILYEATCSNLLSDCVCVDDTGAGGAAESVALQPVGGTTYFLVVDGYSTGGAPPGPSGPYQVTVTRTGGTCNLVPVELIDFSIR